MTAQYLITEDELDYIEKNSIVDPELYGVIRSRPFQNERDEIFPNSRDLLLISHDEWKRREERKHIHEEQPWTSGWISGFLTSRKFVKEQIKELRSKMEEKG